MKLYHVCEKHGIQEVEVLNLRDRFFFVKWPEGLEWAYERRLISEKITDGQPFFYSKTLAIEALRRIIDAEARKIEKFRTQLYTL